MPHHVAFSSTSNARVWLEDVRGNIITEVKLVANTTMEPVYCRFSSNYAKYTLDLKLPKGINLDDNKGLITGSPSELFPRTNYTLTAEGYVESATTSFFLSVTSCEYTLLYPKFAYSGSGNFILSKDNNVYYNQTFYARESSKYAICVPPMEYEYMFTCTDSSSTCFFYVEDTQGWVYLNTYAGSELSTQGVMETSLSAKAVVSFPSLITIATNEQINLLIPIRGVRGDISIFPPLPSSLLLKSGAGLLSGRISDAMMQLYTMTVKTPLGDLTTQFTLAVGQCPSNLHPLTIYLNRKNIMERWRVFDAQNTLLYDQVTSSDSDTHGVCWTPGSYRFELVSFKGVSWSPSSRLDVRDATGVLAEFWLPDGASSVSHSFAWEYVVSQQSEWKMQRGSVDKKWTRVKFNDKKWESGHDGTWGSFSKDISSVFLRRSFSVDASKFTFLHLSIKRSDDCEVVAYLNEKEVVHLTGNASTPFMRLTFPVSTLLSNSVVAMEVRRAVTAQESAPIVFDVVVSAASSGPIVQSVNGLASDNQQGTQTQARSAFDMNTSTYWSATAFPAVLTYTFSKASVVMNRVAIYNVHYGSFDSLRVEGVNGNSTVVLYSVEDSHMMRNGIKILNFDNDQAFPTYQLVFGASSMISISDIRFFSVSDRQCTKRWGYPMAWPGETRYGRCSLFTVGMKQMRCVEEDNVVRWEEDRSACVSRLPSRQWSFVDWSFELANVTTIEWNSAVRSTVVQLLTTHMKVAENEIDFLLVRDTTDSELKLSVISRMTLEAEIGDYILKHFKLFEPDFNSELEKVHKDAAIRIVEMKLREPMNLSSIVDVCVTIAIMLVLMVVEYFVCVRVKSPQTKSLKHLKEGSLLSESV